MVGIFLHFGFCNLLGELIVKSDFVVVIMKATHFQETPERYFSHTKTSFWPKKGPSYFELLILVLKHGKQCQT